MGDGNRSGAGTVDFQITLAADCVGNRGVDQSYDMVAANAVNLDPYSQTGRRSGIATLKLRVRSDV